MEKIKKSELRAFAKNCAFAYEKAVNLVCISEEISKEKITNELINENEAVLLEVSKLFAKYTKEELEIDLESGDVLTVQSILNSIITCCNEHNWFEE